jgi:recombination protein RecT
MSTEKLKEKLGMTTAVAAAPAREITPYEKFRNYFSGPQMRTDLKVLLGSDKLVDTFIRVVLTAVQQTPALLDADRRSLLLACMKAAHDGLMPDGREAVFNIYSTKQKRPGGDVWVPAVQYLPMSGGLIKKLWETSLLEYLDAAPVYEKDRFLFSRGLDVKLEHEPYLGEGERGQIIAAYCVVRLKGSSLPKLEVMGRHDLDSVKNASKSAEKGPWSTWPGEMAVKSVIKRIYKQLPHTAEVDKLVDSDNQAMGFTQMSGGAVGELHAEHPDAERPVDPPALENAPSPTLDPAQIPDTVAVPAVNQQQPQEKQ